MHKQRRRFLRVQINTSFRKWIDNDTQSLSGNQLRAICETWYLGKIAYSYLFVLCVFVGTGFVGTAPHFYLSLSLSLHFPQICPSASDRKRLSVSILEVRYKSPALCCLSHNPTHLIVGCRSHVIYLFIYSFIFLLTFPSPSHLN